MIMKSSNTSLIPLWKFVTKLEAEKGVEQLAFYACMTVIKENLIAVHIPCEEASLGDIGE